MDTFDDYVRHGRDVLAQQAAAEAARRAEVEAANLAQWRAAADAVRDALPQGLIPNVRFPERRDSKVDLNNYRVYLHADAERHDSGNLLAVFAWRIDLSEPSARLIRVGIIDGWEAGNGDELQRHIEDVWVWLCNGPQDYLPTADELAAWIAQAYERHERILEARERKAQRAAEKAAVKAQASEAPLVPSINDLIEGARAARRFDETATQYQLVIAEALVNIAANLDQLTALWSCTSSTPLD